MIWLSLRVRSTVVSLGIVARRPLLEARANNFALREYIRVRERMSSRPRACGTFAEGGRDDPPPRMPKSRPHRRDFLQMLAGAIALPVPAAIGRHQATPHGDSPPLKASTGGHHVYPTQSIQDALE